MRKQLSTCSAWQGKAGLILLLGLTTSGCGSSTATVSGHVRYQGSPLPAGTVSFYGPGNQVANAAIKTDGSYTATNVPPGEVKVAVTTPQPQSKGMENALQKMKKGKGASSDAKTISLPVQYRDPERSGLALTVKNGSQPFDIELK